MIPGYRSSYLLVGLTLLSGCAAPRVGSATAGAGAPSPRPTQPVALAQAQVPAESAFGIIYCADGAGGFGATTEALRYNLDAQRSSVRVELVDWSHGRGRMLADHLDHANIVAQGDRLARQVRQSRAAYPDVPVSLIGHSAGCAVVLVAAEQLERDTLAHVVLLAPSVSASYDLRPALAATSQGVDSFSSRRDWLILGVNMWLSGTTDRRWGPCAGRVGFRPVGTTPYDAALYRRLHQHSWEPGDVKDGHGGDHYGSFEDAYLRARVLPILTKPAAPRPAGAAQGPDATVRFSPRTSPTRPER